MSVIQSLFKLLSWIAIVATTVVDLGKNVSADERFYIVLLNSKFIFEIKAISS